MLFLLRLAFWILVICLLIPGAPQDNRRILTSAQRTVADVRGFCARNPDVCNDARSNMTIMLAKLKKGVDLLQTWLSRDTPKPRGGAMFPSTPAPANPPPAPGKYDRPIQIAPGWSDSLNKSDRVPPWHGPG